MVLEEADQVRQVITLGRPFGITDPRQRLARPEARWSRFRPPPLSRALHPAAR